MKFHPGGGAVTDRSMYADRKQLPSSQSEASIYRRDAHETVWTRSGPDLDSVIWKHLETSGPDVSRRRRYVPVDLSSDEPSSRVKALCWFVPELIHLIKHQRNFSCRSSRLQIYISLRFLDDQQLNDVSVRFKKTSRMN